MKKLCFCFMIYDKINKLDIWNEFFDQADENKYSILIHSKYEITNSNGIMKNIISETYPSKWGEYSLVNIQNRLFELGLKDKLNKKFILVSGSHIPLHNFNYIYNKLINNSNSYLNYELATHKCHTDRFLTINNIDLWDHNNWHTNSQWCILNRYHVKYILKNENRIINIFNNSDIPDEHAYINIFINDNQMKNIKNKNMTKIDWIKNSTVFTYNNNELSNIIIKKFKKKYLFIRKVESDCIIDKDILFYYN